jgi:hypothetical protein
VQLAPDFQRLRLMIPCAEKWGSSFRSEKKTQDPPSQTEGGGSLRVVVSCLAKQFMFADRLCEKKESRGRPGHPGTRPEGAPVPASTYFGGTKIKGASTC